MRISTRRTAEKPQAAEPAGLRGGFACWLRGLSVVWVACLLSLHSFAALPAQQSPPAPAVPGKPAEPAPAPSAPRPDAKAADNADAPAEDWAPELLDAILTSSNSSAAESLYDAAFAAGPAIIPQLQAALRDDRTAEFAAQCLAYLGGEQAFKTLAALISDRRNLDLRRFFLGSLGEYHTPEITQALLNAVEKSDQEPDRTVTEAAVWALTVRSDPALAAELRRAESKIEDVVVRDDVDNALQVIEARARYLASPEGKKAGGSIQEAVRAYFIAALENPAPPIPKRPTGPSTTPPQPPAPKAEVQRLTFTPDQTRALAHVSFEDSNAVAKYDIVLQKQLGDWVVVSVWVSSEIEKPAPPATRTATPKPPDKTR